jgi:hypothetical protein
VGGARSNGEYSPSSRRERAMKHKTLGYVIVMDGQAVRHQDTDPYWLQFSSFCDLYPTYAAARADVRKELRKMKAARGRPGASKRMLDKWTETLRIIPVKTAKIRRADSGKE